MPSGARRLLLAGGVLLLAACDDGDPPASSDTEPTSATTADRQPTTSSSDTTRPARTTTTDRSARSSGPASSPTSDTASASTVATTTTTTSTTLSPDAAACRPVIALADAVALAGGIDFSLPWPQLQANIVDSSAAAAQSYRAVIAVAPPGVDDDLETLADYNLSLGGAAATASSVTAFQAAVQPPDDALLEATAEVDRFMRASCSIGLTAD